MTTAPSDIGRELTAYSIAALLMRRWRIVAACAFLGAVVLVTPAALRPPLYRSLASFQPLAGADVRGGLSGFAGQLGLALPSVRNDQSPEFYSTLLLSRALLGRVARDSFATQNGGRRIPFVDLFEARSGSPAARLADAELILKEHVSVSISRAAGVVEISVVSEWANVSYTIVQAFMREVDAFNKESKQGQASAERRFLEARLKEAGAELHGTEDRLQQFLVTNRQLGLSPILIVERERLNREVQIAQQVYTQLRQSYEDARVREIRDTPVISPVESPVFPFTPLPRKRIKRLLLGLSLGSAMGVFLLFLGRDAEQRLASGDPDVEFLRAWLAPVGAVITSRYQSWKARGQAG